MSKKGNEERKGMEAEKGRGRLWEIERVKGKEGKVQRNEDF